MKWVVLSTNCATVLMASVSARRLSGEGAIVNVDCANRLPIRPLRGRRISATVIAETLPG